MPAPPDPPYTPEFLMKLATCWSEMTISKAPVGFDVAALIANDLLAHGIGLVDTTRARMWIDERVYSGALFRLRLAERPPSITLSPHPDAPPAHTSVLSMTIAVTPPPARSASPSRALSSRAKSRDLSCPA